ncbi:MAG: NAD(P)H-dependent oxidoreductase [Cellvibrio sp.]|jgi:Predicted flavoprotein
MRVLGFSGGLSNPSKTLGLVQAIVNEFSHLHQVDVEIIDLAQLATGFGAVLYRNQLNGFHESLLNDIEQSDVLVVASPVYRAAYPGLFKHVFDLVERGGLEHKPVILAANGGSAHHALVIESHLRPLFSSLGAFTVPTGIYSQSSDFTGYELTNEPVLQRAREAIAEAVSIHSSLAGKREPAAVTVQAIA